MTLFLVAEEEDVGLVPFDRVDGWDIRGQGREEVKEESTIVCSICIYYACIYFI